MTDAVAGAPAPSVVTSKPSLWTKLSYGVGSVAFGIKDQGFAYFLLLFYSQVIGLDAALVGLALTVALVFDAIIDPVLGYWSDNFRSKWGRRHPFMYAAIIPVGATYFLLWTPPEGWSQTALFWYLLTLAVIIRAFVAVYETASAALAPELTDDYDQRSSLMSYRYYFAWTGGNAMSVGMFALLFPAFVTATISNGQFNRDAYVLYGIIASIGIAISMTASAIGTHSRIAHLPPPPPPRKMTLIQVFKEIFETLFNRSFISLFISAMFGAVAGGMSAALAFFNYTYFWSFSSAQVAVVTGGVFISAIIGSFMAPYITKTMGKKKGAIIIGLIAFLGSPLPMVLKLFGILPDDPNFNFIFVAVATTIDVGLIICFQILSSSMMADLVEQAELKTGRRSEGLFFAAATFIRKMVNGLGIMVATLVLALAQFPSGADPSEVPPEAVWRLGAYYVPIILALWLAMVFVIQTYKLSREDHEENLRKLKEQRAQ